jgi:CheY-like chemotaxis protein
MKSRNQLKVFIVDDSLFCRNMYKQHLLNLGFTDIFLFEDGESCLQNMNLSPDLILLDYDMGTLNGMEVLQKVKSFNPTIHLMMISARKDSVIASDALKHGAMCYITKNENDLEMISFQTSKIAPAVTI